jgi:hypothetical protein
VRAAARSANQEAVAYFTTALGLLDAAPEMPETLSDALDIRIALGPTLIAINGAGAPVVADCYGQALKLVERLDDTSRSFPVLWGLWFVQYNRGKYPVAREAADRLLALPMYAGLLPEQVDEVAETVLTAVSQTAA